MLKDACTPSSGIRMVLLYTAGDGYTFSADMVIPFIAESPEQAIVDFEDQYRKAKRYRTSVKVGLHQFDASDFEFEGVYRRPDFLTVDEWFAQLES